VIQTQKAWLQFHDQQGELEQGWLKVGQRAEDITQMTAACLPYDRSEDLRRLL
jgi:hypothetical protein